jgi:hypothetical protein
MKVELRLANAEVGSITNVMFKPRKVFHLSLLPLPTEWIKDPKCNICNGPANFLMEDFKPVCRGCIKGMMKGVNKKDSSTDTSIPITMDVVSRARFEWSTDGEKWYSLMGKGIKPDRPEIFLNELRKSLLENHPMVVEAEYFKEQKEMKVVC